METNKGKRGGQCSQLNCWKGSKEGLMVGKLEVWFCDEHFTDAWEEL